MAQVFSVERNKNFTVMSNHHFKNKDLSLKAKGLLSLMLSLPEDWNYNMQGLASLSRDGINSVRSAIKGLEYYGYVERNMIRNEYGLFTGTEYIIFRNKDYHVEFAGADIYPQGFAAAFYRLQDFKGINMRADIGNGTMNNMYINNSRPLKKKCFTDSI